MGFLFDVESLKRNIEVQLCKGWIIKEGKNTALDKPMWIQPKIDGIRNVMILSDSPESLSRNGKPNHNTEEILDILSKHAKDYVVDGELYAGSFDKTITAVKTHSYKTDELVFYAFDIIPLSEFEDRTCSMMLKDRDGLLSEIIKGCDNPKIRYIEHEEVSSNVQINDITKRFIKQGYEGSVIKNPDSLYRYSRGDGWYKYKPYETHDYKIIATIEGNGRLKDSMGSMIVDVNGVEVRVGTGFRDEDRIRLWNMKEQLVGRYAEVKFQKINGSGALRHPVFIRLREDL